MKSRGSVPWIALAGGCLMLLGVGLVVALPHVQSEQAIRHGQITVKFLRIRHLNRPRTAKELRLTLHGDEKTFRFELDSDLTNCGPLEVLASTQNGLPSFRFVNQSADFVLFIDTMPQVYRIEHHKDGSSFIAPSKLRSDFRSFTVNDWQNTQDGTSGRIVRIDQNVACPLNDLYDSSSETRIGAFE